jgi:hypothetical protein
LDGWEAERLIDSLGQDARAADDFGVETDQLRSNAASAVMNDADGIPGGILGTKKCSTVIFPYAWSNG